MLISASLKYGFATNGSTECLSEYVNSRKALWSERNTIQNIPEVIPRIAKQPSFLRISMWELNGKCPNPHVISPVVLLRKVSIHVHTVLVRRVYLATHSRQNLFLCQPYIFHYIFGHVSKIAKRDY
jgi:hypothetical protein